MAYCEERADRIRKALQSVEGITERKMFGGLSFMLGGNMCCGIANRDLVVRVRLFGDGLFLGAFDLNHNINVTIVS